MLVAFMVPPADEDAFNAWYDEEHVPLRLATPGFLSGRRYRRAANADAEFVYAAFYELETLSVLQSEEYQRLAREPSERERAVLASIPRTSRRVVELVVDCAPAEWADAPYQLVVCMTPAARGVDDFVAWYRQEHIPMLLEVPGWKRCRLFRQVEGDGPAFMATHELESPRVFDHAAYERAISTPWRERIRASVLGYERQLFKLWRTHAELAARVAGLTAAKG